MNRIGIFFAAASLIAASAAAFAVDKSPSQVLIEPRLVYQTNEELRDLGLTEGWGIGLEARFFDRRHGSAVPTLGVNYDQLQCRDGDARLRTYGIQGGFLGQFDASRSPAERQLLWRASAGYFRTKVEGGSGEDSGLGFEAGIQYGALQRTRGWSVALLYSHRPDAFGESNRRLVALISLPIGP